MLFSLLNLSILFSEILTIELESVGLKMFSLLLLLLLLALRVADLSKVSSSSSKLDKLSGKFCSMFNLSFDPLSDPEGDFLDVCSAFSFIFKKCSLFKLGDLAFKMFFFIN